MRESDFTTQVIDLAHWCGWLAFHQLPAQHRAGKWSSATQGDTGFPDLILARDRVVVAELKVGKNKPTEKQWAWINRFRESGVEAYVWTPDDMDEIRQVLRRSSGSTDRHASDRERGRAQGA